MSQKTIFDLHQRTIDDELSFFFQDSVDNLCKKNRQWCDENHWPDKCERQRTLEACMWTRRRK